MFGCPDKAMDSRVLGSEQSLFPDAWLRSLFLVSAPIFFSSSSVEREGALRRRQWPIHQIPVSTGDRFCLPLFGCPDDRTPRPAPIPWRHTPRDPIRQAPVLDTDCGAPARIPSCPFASNEAEAFALSRPHRPALPVSGTHVAEKGERGRKPFRRRSRPLSSGGARIGRQKAP